MRTEPRGAIYLEFTLLCLLMFLILKEGFLSFLIAYKSELQEIQKQRLIYDGKQLWEDGTE